MPYPSPGLYPDVTVYPGFEDIVAPTVGKTLEIRERPPLRLMLDVVSPGGNHTRWAGDEPQPSNVPHDYSHSWTMPGGAEQMSCVLPRKPGVDYDDLAEFSTITSYGVGGEVAWQGRLETTPSTSGDQMAITPGAVGFQAHLDDNQSVREIIVDIDVSSNWTASTAARKADLSGASIDMDDPSTVTDPVAGQPAFETGFAGAWTRHHSSEGQYDAKGLIIGSVYYAWKRQSVAVDNTDTNWSWTALLSPTDRTPFTASSGNLRAAGPGTGTVTGTGVEKFATVGAEYAIAGGADGVNYAIDWTVLAVYGNHNLTLRGTADATHAQGVLASDVITYVIAKWAPKLSTVRAGVSTIERSSFVIPQLVFTDPTTCTEIVNQSTRFELQDWWVDEGPTFNLAARQNHGRRWRARAGVSGLQETGPQVDRIWNQVIVQYQDVTGITRTVGPVGSGATTEDATLSDSDPLNPVTLAGLTRCVMLSMGTSTPAAATVVGSIFLQEAKALSTAGQATLVGYVLDDRGVVWPAWKVRAGDQISFVDAANPGYRRIVRASYTDAQRSCQIDLDSPPQALDALLQRLSVVLTPLGFS